MADDMNKVAVLIEDLMSQFRAFGEGQQILNDRMTDLETGMNSQFAKVNNSLTEIRIELAEIKDELANFKAENAQEHQAMRAQNEREHQEMKQMTADQKIISEKLASLDQEFETKIRRVK